MSPAQPPAALTVDERRAVLAVELLTRRDGRAPTWAELRLAAGIGGDRLPRTLHRLRRAGMLTFALEPRSLRATPAGLRAALGRAVEVRR